MTTTTTLDHAPLVTTVTALACAGAGVASWFGLRALMAGTGAEGWIVPSVSALVIAVGLFSLWHMLLRAIPRLVTPVSQILGVTLGLVMALVTIAVSAWFVATALAGETALRHHLALHLETYRTALERAYTNVKAEEGLRSVLGQEAAVMRSYADAEAAGDNGSGAGCGPRCRLYQRTAASFETVRDEVAAVQTRAFDLYDQGSELLTGMQATLSTAEDLAEAQRRFAGLTADLQGVVVELSALSSLEEMRNVGIVVTGTGADTVQPRVDEGTARLREAAQRVAREREAVPTLSYRPMNTALASWVYAGEIAGAWAVGIGVDLMPLLILFLVMLSTNERRHMGEAPLPLSFPRARANDGEEGDPVWEERIARVRRRTN